VIHAFLAKKGHLYFAGFRALPGGENLVAISLG